MKRKPITVSSRYLVQCFWFILALGSVVGLGFIYIQTLNPVKHTLYRQFSAKYIDSSLTELTVMQFNAEGQLSHLLNTPLMQHLPKKNMYFLEKPHLIVTEANQSPWEIQADKAKARADKRITLTNHVVIQQKQSETKQALKLMTEKITYFPQSKFATTSHPVTIQQAKNQVKAIGMHAYLVDNKIELLSHVRGHYEPPKPDAKT